MPIPKRWFPTSRDLNDDPEVWELTDMFGDRALRIHLEILAILDRTENEWRQTGHWLAGLSRKVRQQPATVQRVVGWMLVKGWLDADQPTLNGSPVILSARNYWKYHRRRETNRSQGEAGDGPSLPNLPDPNLPETNGGLRKERSSAPVERNAIKVDDPPKKTIASWEAYREAYIHRYQTPPVRNGKVNGMLARFVDRLGTEQAPKVAKYFLSCDDPYYLRIFHSLEALLRDAETLHTRMVTGRRTTNKPTSMVSLL